MMNTSSLSHLWEVLILFSIPIGGGIPVGVVLAKKHGIPWPMMMLLYFISDVMLAVVFEPLMWLVIAGGKKSRFLTRFTETLKSLTKKTTANYGTQLGPLALIMISFGVDPMTGRGISVAAGHGFLAGWTLAILGDMIYFTLIMVSTLFLNNILGDGTWTTVIIMVAMMAIPAMIRRFRDRRRKVLA